jgi:hypothetical protein
LADPGLPSTSRLVVCVSPKVELMFVVAGLASGWDAMIFGQNRQAATVLESAQRYFRPYAGHPAVTALGRMRNVGFWFDALPKLALAYSDPPAMEQIYPLSSYLIGRGRGERPLQELMYWVKDFAEQSGFGRWWEENRPRYEAIEQHCRYLAESGDPLGVLEAYFGERLSALLIIPSGLIACGFGGTLDDPEGQWGINCFGPAEITSGDTITSMTYHEGGHSFVNHLADENPELVGKYQPLYGPIESQMRSQAYGRWSTALNEHVLRACHARIYLATKGQAAAEQRLQRDEGQGFLYVRALYNKLAEYEAARDKYPDLASFYPALLGALDRFR